MRDFLKKQFADRYFLFLIVFFCGFGIGYPCGIGIVYFQMNKNADKKYELGYLDACKDFYKGKTKYDLVKNEDGTVEWKKVDK